MESNKALRTISSASGGEIASGVKFICQYCFLVVFPFCQYSQLPAGKQ